MIALPLFHALFPGAPGHSRYYAILILAATSAPSECSETSVPDPCVCAEFHARPRLRELVRAAFVFVNVCEV